MLETAGSDLSCPDRSRRTSADAAVCVADAFRHRWFSALRSTYARESWRTGFKPSGASKAGSPAEQHRESEPDRSFVDSLRTRSENQSIALVDCQVQINGEVLMGDEVVHSTRP